MLQREGFLEDEAVSILIQRDRHEEKPQTQAK